MWRSCFHKAVDLSWAARILVQFLPGQVRLLDPYGKATSNPHPPVRLYAPHLTVSDKPPATVELYRGRTSPLRDLPLVGVRDDLATSKESESGQMAGEERIGFQVLHNGTRLHETTRDMSHVTGTQGGKARSLLELTGSFGAPDGHVLYLI